MRKEKDSLGELDIPDGAYYGIQAFRASQNFPISGTQVHPELLKTYLLLKRAAAKANCAVGALDQLRGDAIVQAVDGLLNTDVRRHFIVDAYQAGGPSPGPT